MVQSIVTVLNYPCAATPNEHLNWQSLERCDRMYKFILVGPLGQEPSMGGAGVAIN